VPLREVFHTSIQQQQPSLCPKQVG
jgi:hypothetical protein